MPWKQVKNPILRSPARQDFIIISVSLIIGLLMIAYFARNDILALF